jgi:urease accessory protein
MTMDRIMDIATTTATAMALARSIIIMAECGDMRMNESSYLLLQINDAAFPIGSFTHSFGLETYILNGQVTTTKDGERYVAQNLKSSFLYSDLLPGKLAWKLARAGDIDGLVRLERELRAYRPARETREAASKLGIRFARTAALLCEEDGLFARYVGAAGRDVSRPVSYGVFCADANIACMDALAHYLYAHASGMVTCCLKTVPLSQSEGQHILTAIRPVFRQVMEELESLNADDMMRSCPGLEARSMQHERLYSRMYIS